MLWRPSQTPVEPLNNGPEELTIGDWQRNHRGLDRFDSHLLLTEVLQVSRASVIAHPEHGLTGAQAARLTELARRRMRGEPMAYLLGRQEFYGRQLTVTHDVLIPRPETETLVELALELIPTGERVLELGTGSGAIAIALAETFDVTATDASAPALAIAQANARQHKTNITFAAGDWFHALPSHTPPFAAIVSNPPYVADNHPALDELSFEPRSALASGPDGMDDIRQIVAAASRYLTTGGWLMLEHGFDQAEALGALLAASGYSQIACHRDLAGIDRVTIGQWPAEGGRR